MNANTNQSLDALRTIREELATNRETLVEQETLVGRIRKVLKRGEPVTVDQVDHDLAEIDERIAAEEARIEAEATCATRGAEVKPQAEALIEDIDRRISELVPLLRQAHQLADAICSEFANPELPGTLVPPFKGTPITHRLRFWKREIADQFRAWKIELGQEQPLVCKVTRPEPGTHRRPTLNEIRKIEAEGRARGSRSTLASVQAMDRG